MAETYHFLQMVEGASRSAISETDLRISFMFRGKEYELDLQENVDLFGLNYFHEEQIYDNNGVLIQKRRVPNNAKVRENFRLALHMIVVINPFYGSI